MEHAGQFSDALPLLEAALADLAPGQIICDERVNLMDLMSAVEIMDARTDSFLSLKQGREKEAELPQFDPKLELLPQELIWILDEVLRLETTFQDGHPLASTLFTCRYIRPEALAALSLTPDTLGDPARPSGFRAVLRAMLLGVIKTAEIIWEELTKGQVYEHEDVHLGLASLDFTALLSSCFPPSPPSRLRVPGQGAEEPRVVTVDEVLQALSEALAWVMDKVRDEGFKMALVHRLTTRINLVYALALLTAPSQTAPEAILPYLNLVSESIASLSGAPPAHLEPSPKLLAIFALSTTAPLPAPQPPREIPPFPLERSYACLQGLIDDVGSAVRLWDLWTQGAGWAEVREYRIALSRREMTPYARSIHQSITFTSRTLFASCPSIDLGASFLSTLAGVAPATWQTLAQIREKETTWDAPARKLLGFTERLSTQLVVSLANRCQNRARARRLVVKGFRQLAQLIEEAEELQPRFNELLPSTPSLAFIPSAIRSLLLAELLEALLSGFDLNLYDAEEWVRVWWVAERLLGRLLGVLEELKSSGAGGQYVEAKWLEAGALREMCTASLTMALLLPPAVPRLSAPLLAFDDAEQRDQQRFEKRFGWLKGSLGAEQQPLDDLASWAEYSAHLERLHSLETREKMKEASRAYEAAVSALTSFGSIPLAARGTINAPEHQLRWMASLRRTCFANLNLLGSLARRPSISAESVEDNANTISGSKDVRWDSKWFPIWS